jgi:hypothetical protein
MLLVLAVYVLRPLQLGTTSRNHWNRSNPGIASTRYHNPMQTRQLTGKLFPSESAAQKELRNCGGIARTVTRIF